MADLALLALNFSAGAYAFFSPCGFPMLPAYLAYYLPRADADAPEPRGRALARGLAGGALAATGAVAVLAAVGALAAWLGNPFKQHVVMLELVGGLVLVALGSLTLAGRGPSFKVAFSPSRSRSALGLVGFGALYAAVAAGCVAPVFLAVLSFAFLAPTPLDAVLQVGAYAAGLATLLVALSVLVATAQHSAVRALRRVLPHVERAGGAVLVAVGLYLVWYWARVQGLA